MTVPPESDPDSDRDRADLRPRGRRAPIGGGPGERRPVLRVRRALVAAAVACLAGSAVLAALLDTAWRDGSGAPWATAVAVLVLLAGLYLYHRAPSATAALPAKELAGDRLQETDRLAHHDALTGLPNRRRYVERLTQAIAAAAADPPQPYAVMVVGCDALEAINDRHGHAAGDELLVQSGRRIQERLRPQDLVARLGGDAFAVLVCDLGDEQDAIALAERLLEALAAPLPLPDGVQALAGASIGITYGRQGYGSADAALADADRARYQARHGGRARYAVCDAGLRQAVSRRLRLRDELHDALASGQLTVEYQPMLELSSLRLTGFEALVRWPHPRRGLLQPAQFLGLAEESGLMPQLSDFVLHGACRQLRRWQHLDARWAGLTISVNVSASELVQPGFAERVDRALRDAALDPACLSLEIAEPALTRNGGAGPTAPAPVLAAALRSLHDLGVRLAVDDFGTGASTLVHLARLPVDTLKIDRSFVARLKADGGEPALVQAIVQIAQTLRKAVVAEGVESEAQSEWLQRLGCTVGQGYHLGRPLSAQAARAWLQSHPAGSG